LLSPSASPAFGPCGMPFFVAPAAALPPLEDVLLVAGALEDVLLVAAAPEDPDEDEAEDGELDELDELDPQAASARATSTSPTGASRRIDVCVSVFMRSGSFASGASQTCSVPASERAAHCIDASTQAVIPAPYRCSRNGPEPFACGKETGL
jgi:hypothetical protein